jgi:hypothetical protein
MASCGTISKEGRLASSRCTLIISFHEGCSRGEDLEAVLFIVGFLTVVDFLAAVDFLVALDLVTREDLERAGDFFPTAEATGEARGDGRGEDIDRVVLALVLWDDGSGGGES